LSLTTAREKFDTLYLQVWDMNFRAIRIH